MGRLRLAFASILLLVVLTSCTEQSRVDPEAVINVRGTVVGPDGSPIQGRPVKLGAGISATEGAFAVLTVGLACASGACRGAVHETTTDADGNYALSLRGRETQSSFGEAVSILVSATGATPAGHVSGALTSARFRVQTEEVTVPSLTLVDAGLVVEGDGQVSACWATGRPAPYDLTFEIDRSTPVWQVRTAEGGAVVDARVLEDSSGRVVVSGGHEEAIEGSDVAIRWRPRVGATRPGQARLRLVADRAANLDAGGQPVASSPCELTDGDLVGRASAPSRCVETANPDAPRCEPTTRVEVELGAALPGELVVVRGCEGGCPIEVTADGVDYRAVGSAGAGFGTVPLDGQLITAVRVGLGSSPFGLREVSVWGPRPARPALRSLDQDDRADLGAPFDGDGDGGGDDGSSVPAGLTVAAAALAAAALLGAGFVAGRRRVRT